MKIGRGRARRPLPISIVVGTVAYAALLHYIYVANIAPLFGYLGFRYRSPHEGAYAASIACVVFLAILLPRRLTRPSHLILWVLFVAAAGPSILIPQYADVLTVGEAFRLALAVTGCFLVVIFGARFKPVKIHRTIRLPPGMFWTGIIVMTILVYAYMLYTTGLSFRFVSLDAVRDIRFEFRDQIEQTGRALAYLVRLQGNIINPIIMVRGIYTRRWALIGAGLAGQLLIFSVTGFKTILLSTPAILAVAFLFRRRLRPAGGSILWGTFVACLLALALDRFLGTITYVSVFVRRFLVAPGLLTAAYVLVFTKLPKVHLGHSFLKGFVTYPYAVSPAFLVGNLFLHKPQTAANANFFADGFMNFGFAGMLVESVVLVVVLWLVDGVSQGMPTGVTALIFLLPTIALANSSVFTSIISHGFLAGILLVAVMPRTGWMKDLPEEIAEEDAAPIVDGAKV